MLEHTKKPADLKPRRAGRPKAADVAEIDSRLIGAARHCFIAKGYGATSMNEVARVARLSKGTLWSRFPTKADLFRAIIAEQIRLTSGTLRHAGPKPKTLEAMLRKFSESALQHSLSRDTAALNRLIYAEAERFPELGEAQMSRARIGIEQVAEYIREYAVRDGISCRDPEFAAEMLTSITRSWHLQMMLRTQPVTVAEIRSWCRKMTKWFVAGRADW